MSSVTLHAKEALYVKRVDLPRELRTALKEKYTFRFYEEKACKKCDVYEERMASVPTHLEVCDSCPAYKGGAALATDVVVGNNKYLRMPIGDQRGLIKLLEHQGLAVKVKEHFPDKKFKRPIKFTGAFRGDYQKEAANAIIREKRGVIKAPPRSGKCIDGKSWVMTKDGLHKISDLFHDYDLPENEFTQPLSIGVTTRVGRKNTSHLYSKIVDKTYSIRTQHGLILRGTPNHKVLVAAPNFKFEWKRMDELTTEDFVVSSRKNQWLGSSLTLNEFNIHEHVPANSKNIRIGYDFPKTMTPELARILGYLIADGSLGIKYRILFSNDRKDIRKDYIKCLEAVFPGLGYQSIKKSEQRSAQINLGGFQTYKFLEVACGLSMTKSAHKDIPDVILRAPKNIVSHFLSAYLSCDSEWGNTGVHVSSASKSLIDQIHNVLPYFGVVGKWGNRKGKLKHATNGLCIDRPYYGFRIKGSDFIRLALQLPSLFCKGSLNFSDEQDLSDKIPYLKSSLFRLHKHFAKNQFTYEVNGRIIHKRDHGILLEDKHGLSTIRNDHFSRRELNKVNVGLMKTLSKKAYNRYREFISDDIIFTQVKSIKVINKPSRVYDLCVPDGHEFIANGLVVHNTVIFSAACCKIGKKTMILASQREWLIGFRETFIGSKTQPALSNCKPSQIGFARKYEDFLKYDICLVTVQTFYSEAGQKLLQKIKSMFHMVGVDEIHTGAAPKYAKVLSELNCERKIGLSGTPNRKDGRFVIMRNLIGPNIYEAKVARLRPRVRLVRTEYSQTSKGQVLWTRLVSGLERNPKRLKLIAQWAIRDAKNGHMVLIPFSQVAPIKALVMAINKLAGKRIAYPFWGGLTGKGKDGRSLRDIYIEAARNYKIKILVGNIKLLSTGTNIPRASAIYEVALSSNLENVEQRVSRVLTPYDGKPEPIVRIFLDDMNVRRRCMQNEFWNAINPLFKPIISEVDMETLKGYFSNKKEHERLTF